MGIFKGGYAMAGPIDSIIPVDLYISGCPPRPQVILGALADALHLNVEGMEELLRTPHGFRGDPHVDESKCVGCGACAHVCPADAIEIVGNGATRRVRFMHKDCIFCGSCQDVCPSEAVELRAGEKAWFQAKDASLSEAHLAVSHCRLCEAPHMPEAQVAWALRRMDEKLALGASDRGMVEHSLGICIQCRRKNIAEVREAKRALASLARRSSA
jgi:formate hydrogenlyase subunit 6/NADH:ubiquinone oxidoreductase subunit I